ncbi:MAG: 4Fe-4S binding protein, partial [Clostridiales bacterium]|nr:4Fe-4S binding protein [Clostridiales bacterium]
ADKCNNCGACMRVCPAKAVEKLDKHHIVKTDCLVCMDCVTNCRQQAISYK